MPESHRANTPLAAGTVTLLFTDIEGSTALWEQDGTRMSQALAAHDALARSAVESRHGRVVKITGDGIHAAFDDALDALAATVDMQQALADPAATNGVALRVRCGLHAGVVECRDNDYFGSPVNRAARIMSAAHGGQVLLSQAVVDGVREKLPAAVSLRDLGKVRLKDLAAPEHVYQVVHPQLRQEFPALRSLEAVPNNLPQQVTSFIGREKEVKELKRLLERTHLLTPTGSGGCGKTRLCLQVAADALEQFPDGAWLVELAPLADPGLVPQTVAKVLGLKEEPGKPIGQTLTEHLKDKRLLLLLDNCEHLLDGCAKLADALVRQCPHLKILASSREALGIGGEQAYRVPSLSLPDPKQVHTSVSVAPFEAVQLFTDRALLACAEFQVTNQNASTLASICYRLDGIPLAIELAAARVRSLGVEEIDGKLDQRFRVLTGGSRTALPRHQTLRSLIDWSYDLLSDSEKLTLQRLSVFAGGWTLAATEKVCAGDGVSDGDVLDRLTSLADKSLVVVEQNDGHYRYRMLETVRQYAREKLAESGGEALRERHRDYFLALAEEAALKLRGPEQAEWLRRLEEEHENLRASLEWSFMETGVVGGLQLCGALSGFWTQHAHFAEGRKWCVRMLTKPGAEKRTLDRARALDSGGVLAYSQGDYAAAHAMHEESLAIGRERGDRRRVAFSLACLGGVAFEQHDLASALVRYQESLTISRELGNRGGMASSLHGLGSVSAVQGDIAAARALFEESLAIGRELGNRARIEIALGSLAEIASQQGEFAFAEALFQESLTIARELGNRYIIARALNGLGEVALARGEFASAQALLSECLLIGRELGDRDGIAACLRNLGMIACEQGNYEAAKALHQESYLIRRDLGDRRGIAFAMEELAGVVAALGSSFSAARIWGSASRLREEMRSPLVLRDRTRYDRRVAGVRAALGDDAAFDHAWQEGRAMSFEQAIDLAFEKTVEQP